MIVRMTLAGNAHRLDVLASRLPVAFQRRLGLFCLFIGIGLLAIVDAICLPRLMFHQTETIALENKAMKPVVPTKKIMPMVHPIAPLPTQITPSPALAYPDLPPLIFQKNAVQLTEESQSTLTKLRTFLDENPTIRVVLSGHTDDQGTDHLNNSLSLERAQEAHDWLVLHGVDPERIHTQGFGSALPLPEGHSQQARARNRRVEITFR